MFFHASGDRAVEFSHLLKLYPDPETTGTTAGEPLVEGRPVVSERACGKEKRKGAPESPVAQIGQAPTGATSRRGQVRRVETTVQGNEQENKDVSERTWTREYKRAIVRVPESTCNTKSATSQPTYLAPVSNLPPQATMKLVPYRPPYSPSYKLPSPAVSTRLSPFPPP